MDLGRGQAGPRGVFHGLDHVLDQAVDLRRARVRDRRRPLPQNRVPHARDFENGHGVYYGTAVPAGKA